MPKVEKQTHEWLTMAEAADRVGKSQATIRSALHKHNMFIPDENWREIKPVLIMPDGTQKPGSGRGNILVRADALETWATSTPERAQSRRVAGMLYKINVRDARISENQALSIADRVNDVCEGMSFHDAIVALLAPFDVNMRKANVRKPQDESPESATASLEAPTAPGTPQESFEFELVEG